MPVLFVLGVKERTTTPASGGRGKPRQSNGKSGRVQRFIGRQLCSGGERGRADERGRQPCRGGVVRQGDSPRDSGVRQAGPGHGRVPRQGAGAGLSLCLRLLSHRADSLRGRPEARASPREGSRTWGPVTAILFKRISLFVIFIRDVIDCG